MERANGIRKHGFHKWYERELLQSHAHLVSIVPCFVFGIWALRRYLFQLAHAEATAHQAKCPSCQTDGRFTPIGANPSQGAVEVCCRKCEQRWSISESPRTPPNFNLASAPPAGARFRRRCPD